MELKEFTGRMNRMTRNMRRLEEDFLSAHGWVRTEQTIKDTSRVLVFWSHPERCASTGQDMAVALEVPRLTNQGTEKCRNLNSSR